MIFVAAMLAAFYALLVALFTIDVLVPFVRHLVALLVDHYQAWQFRRWARHHRRWIRAMANCYAGHFAYLPTAQEVAHALAQLHPKERE